MIETVLTIFLFLIILTLIVSIHEFGHFIMAKRFGVSVEEFSIGMGPLVAKKMWRGTQYSLRALPIGGYVKMLGEGESSNKSGSFSQAKAWKRLIIIYAGVVMNFVLVAFIFSILAIKNDGVFFGTSFVDPNYTYPIADSGYVKLAVAAVEENSPAQQVGLKSGDILNKINNIDYNGIPEFSKILEENPGKTVPIEVVAYLGGDTRTVNVEIRVVPKGQSRTGINISGAPFSRIEYKGFAKPFAGILQTINTSHNYLGSLGFIFGESIKQKNPQIAADALSSPVGIYAVTRRVLDLNGFWGVLTIIAILSLAIGIMNAVPFPALDGWHGLFIIIEIITRKKFNERIYNIVTSVGFVVLLLLGFLIIIKDLLNFKQLFG